MNSVSWFLYIAQISNGLGILFAILGALLLFACGCYTLYQALENEQYITKFRYISLGVGLLILSILVPQKNTLYAIAASQVGEKIIQSEQVKGVADDASKALQQWIRRQIEPEEKKSKKD